MQYTAHLAWDRQDLPFDTKSFDRTHKVTFGSGTSFDASSAPEFAGNAALPNPEELFTASISSCFMLTLLFIAAMKKITINQYSAEAIGSLAKNSEGKMAMTEVVIKPKLTFDGETPDAAVLQDLYKKAHDQCFISSSVKTVVKIEA